MNLAGLIVPEVEDIKASIARRRAPAPTATPDTTASRKG